MEKVSVNLNIFEKISILYRYPTQSVTIKLKQHKSSNARQLPDRKKNGEHNGAGIEPMTFCVVCRRPNH